MKPQSGQIRRSRLSPSGMRVTVGPREAGGLGIAINVAKSFGRRKACVRGPRGGAAAGGLPLLYFDVEIGSAVTAMIGVALPALLVGVELAGIALRRRGDAFGGLNWDNLLARRRERHCRRHRWLQQRSRGQRHCADSQSANPARSHESS